MTETTAREDWDEIQALFPARKGIRRQSFENGMSSRLSGKRMKRLMGSDSAQKLDALLSERGLERVKALRTFASINHEQALAAFRITVVTNVSIPVILLTVMNILAPNLLDSLRNLFNIIANVSFQTQLAPVLFLSVVALWTATFLTYAVLCLGQAREIRHLIDLHAAERGVYFGLEDMDEGSSA